MTDVFTSVHHPGDAPATLVYGRALVGPLGFCMLPVMIGAATAALQETSVLPFMVWGLPAALFVATVWTRFLLGTTPAEIHVRSHQAAVQSVHDCLRDAPLHWQWLHDARREHAALVVTMGFDTYRLRYDEWPDHAALLDALRAARRASASVGTGRMANFRE